MEPLFNRVTDVYRCFLSGSCPDQSAANVARVMFSAVRPVRGPVRGERSPAERAELTCVALTLVEKITCSLQSHRLPPPAASYYEEAQRLLCEEMDLMPQLVHHFQSEDQIISHLAAKSASTCVFYHLHKSGVVSPVWQEKCVETFHGSRPGPELDACLWSLTQVMKKLLKGAHRDILQKLLEAFDCSLSALCLRFLPEEKEEARRSPVDFTSSRLWGATSCLLLDLLEVLTAAGLMCGGRLTIHVHSSALLKTVSCSSQYFVKKQAVLLLKRAVLQKVGEDWALGEALSGQRTRENQSYDMSLLTRSVLTAVANDWLQTVQVEQDAFFGGTRQTRGEDSPEPDCVMLRAVSLILLKSVEFHIQTARATGGHSAAEVSGYLQRLWGFLSVQLPEVTHRCCWISLLFAEQDDDMMEAARALLAIFLNHRLCSRLDDVTVSEAACASGCNPHCHFVLLLQSVSFDHSILLDFLISSETCFLEYFVRYLKYLGTDWRGFAAACDNATQRATLAASGGADRSKLTNRGERHKGDVISRVRPADVNPTMERMTAELRLVDYDSSDESDPEDMEVSEVEPGPSVCDRSRFSAFDVKRETFGPPISTTQKLCESSKPSLSDSNSSLERRAEGLSVLREETSCASMAPPSGKVTCETSAVLCLSELSKVVTRLQTKELFPYNASSLLKLLAQVESCYQQSHPLHSNK
ncbi:protein Lines homolog 1 isoform X2 [Embiotoca jacksoni]|uniref:protein Lines homolog 1 isoform X2 n=1 Tax=Embiotoca jacksoni TaxID=100190 RepID=UPI003704D1E0